MNVRKSLAGLALLVAAVVVAVVILQWRGSGLPLPNPTGPVVGPASIGASAAATVSPAFRPSPSVSAVRRIWLIVMENRSYEQVIGSGKAPFLDDLAARFGSATDYHGVARPSEPNYLALVSGSTQGVRDDGSHDITAPTLFDQLEAAGRGWAVYAENVPGGCFRGSVARGGPDGAGTYARKHEPAISFTAISGDPARCARITDLSHFSPDGADFSLIVPNLCHDMHDCATGVGDAWLRGFVGRITGSPAFADGGLLVVTFDEASGGDGSQHTALVFAGPGIAAGTRATARADHYGLLRTIEDAFGLPCLARSCAAAPMPELLGAGG